MAESKANTLEKSTSETRKTSDKPYGMKSSLLYDFREDVERAWLLQERSLVINGEEFKGNFVVLRLAGPVVTIPGTYPVKPPKRGS